MKRSVRFILLVVLFSLFFLVRGFSAKLFYDPFIDFFKNDYLAEGVFPDYKTSRLFIDILFRYLLNTVVSLGAIYVFFQKKALVFFSIKLYSILFLVLMFIYFLLLKTEFSSGYLLAFYVRRMLIHPVILIILLPAFYFQYKLKKN
jgi:exosortase F-associated protein